MQEIKPVFRKDYSEYRRNLDYVGLYVDQNVTYAKIQDPNLDEAKYREWLLTNMKKDGEFPIFNPRMLMNIKNPVNDRERKVTTMLDYLKDVTVKDLKFVPTFTTYLPEKSMESLESNFLRIGMKNRSIEKKNKFKAKERGDDIMADYHDNMQLMLKILNNSSSGAKAAKGTILYNQTGHSTLTSICRSTTSFANSTNEKFLGGYRHYFNNEVIINNILAVLTFTSIDEVQEVMEKYNLHYVTPDELMWAIKRSTDLYWVSPKHLEQIAEFVNKLTPLQCSSYLYNSDLYMLRQFNEQFVRTMFDKLVDCKTLIPLPLGEAKEWCDVMDDDLAALVAVYVADLCNGKGVRTAMSEHPDIVPIVGAVVKNTIEVFEEYRDLIKTFWVTEIMPFESARVPDMMRGVVLGSDTDSSLFSLDTHWVDWYFGQIIHDDKSMRLVATAVYMTSQHIAHILGMMTGILNIIDEKKPLIAMKNEFLFSSFTTTSAGKHYFAKKDAQEGIMIPRTKMETEIKGVRLKHGKVPADITKAFHAKLDYFMNTIEADKKVSIRDLVREVAKIEHDVYLSVKEGDGTFLQRGQVKVKDAYKTEDSIYKRGYELWEDVFAPKYGSIAPPPYDAVKVSITPNTRTKFDDWVSSFEDKELAQRLIDWVDLKNNGRHLTTFYIPQAIVRSHGVPQELVSGMQPRKLAFQITSPYYLLLESFGYFVQNDKLTRLCSDEIPEFTIPSSIYED